MAYARFAGNTDDAGVPAQRAAIVRGGVRERSRASFIAKRAMDLIIALPALIVSIPIIAVLCVLIYARDRKNPIFSQERYGRHGRVFKCYKLRTMVPDAAERLETLLESDAQAAAEWERDHKLRNDPRVTGFGRFLRKTSLDELPQLINVIKGEMSIVGPRPIVHREIEKYGAWFAYYVQTRPGITGLWQVGGRNDISYGSRVALDTQYVREWSVLGDLVILLKTVPLIISRTGAY